MRVFLGDLRIHRVAYQVTTHPADPRIFATRVRVVPHRQQQSLRSVLSRPQAPFLCDREAILPGAIITHRWSGQVVETVDGLTFIGETREGQFIATRFSGNGNGMAFGTVAAMMAHDAVHLYDGLMPSMEEGDVTGHEPTDCR